MPRVRIHGSTQCAVEKAPPGANTLHAIFFFFFFFLKKYELIMNFEAKSMLKWGILDLEILIKAKWTILTKEFGATYLCDRLSHRWLGTEGKGSCGWLPGVVVKNRHFVPPVLEP